ncbi:type IV conjugative transfer system coupling protein TraD [Candidatus Odyssella thessalonicensis]|uniref:type IV conjugative transfer system coupling protein TraD n=1 Tax=Candidatus Odyssella thessalonicensis TaxID=84647 RepID=UPI000225A9DE|nr:type IV conjugative transfer system coupling protein TraD [Candidatus Odyssella thessalonicensis]
MSLIKKFTQGGQVTLHNVRMLRQVLSVTLLACAIIGGGFFSYKTYNAHTIYEWNAFKSYLEAQLKTILPFVDKNKATQIILFSPGRPQRVRSLAILQHPWVQEQVDHIKATALSHFFQTLWVMIGTFALFIRFWSWRGRIGSEKEILSGTQVVEGNLLKKLVKSNKEASDIKLANVPLIKNKELQHLLIVGTTGAGKSNCIHELLQQIRDKKQRAIIVDVTGSFIEKYYRPGVDKILNPLDKRSESWTIWADCTAPYHYEALAAAFVPTKQEDDFWVNSARTLFVTTALQLKARQQTSIQEFLIYSILAPLHVAADFYLGTPAGAFINQQGDKMSLSVRATLAANIKCLEWLKETSKPFSIRQWISQDSEEGEWLFLASVPEMREALKPLLTAWASIATQGLLSLPPSYERRLWFIIDELPALKKLPDLQTMLAEARKYGGCAVVGTQDMSLLDEIYGHHLVKSITNLCSTKVVFRVAGADVADRVSKWLGSQEVSESIENISYGAHQMRDGVSLNDQRREKAAINADKLMKLADLEAYLKLPGHYPVGHVKFKYHDLPTVAPSFVARPKDEFEATKVQVVSI